MIDDIRRDNIKRLYESGDFKSRDGFAKHVGLGLSTVQGYFRKGRPQKVTDQKAAIIEEAFKLPQGKLDENNLPKNLPAEIPKRGKSKKTTTSGELRFTADGFSMNCTFRSGSTDEAEVMRLALRIVEIRSR
jgi:hypothetical protein